jgi:hypothetical protein
MWVDILTPDQAKRFPPVVIQRPPPEPFELRVVLWRADKVKAMDDVRALGVLCRHPFPALVQLQGDAKLRVVHSPSLADHQDE